MVDDATRVDDLVSRGGGTKGLLLLGIQQELEAQGAWRDVRMVSGSSAGGIISMMQAIGMTGQEIQDIMAGNEDKGIKALNFKDYQDKSTPYWHEALGLKKIDVFNVFEKTEPLHQGVRALRSKGKGVFKGDAFSDFAKLLIAQKTGNPNITFKELHEMATNPDHPGYDPRYKDAMFTGTKIQPPPAELKLFNHETTPNMPIWQAVRITMSFPGAFKAVEVNGEIFVDGGLKDNLPIQPVVDFKQSEDAAHVRNTDRAQGVIAVSMETASQIFAVQGNKFTEDQKAAMLEYLKASDCAIPEDKKEQLLGFIERGEVPPPEKIEELGLGKWIQGMATAALGNAELLKKYQDQIVMPWDLEEETLNFDMSDTIKERLLNEGRRAAQEMLGKRPDIQHKDGYRAYHKEKDFEHIIDKWKERRDWKAINRAERVQALDKELAGLVKEYGLDFNVGVGLDVTEDSDPGLAEFTKHLEQQWQAKEQRYEQAVEVAKERTAKNEEAVQIYFFKENLDTVGDMIRIVDDQKREVEAFESYINANQELSRLLNEVISSEELSRPMELATESLGDSLRQMGDIVRRNNGIPSEKSNDELQQLHQNFIKKLETTALDPEQRTNLISIHSAYLAQATSEIDAKNFPEVSNGNLSEFHDELQQTTAEMIDTLNSMKKELASMEAQTARAGSVILAKTEQDKEAVLEAPKDSHTMAKLKGAHQEQQQKFDNALKNGDFAQVKADINFKHYEQVVEAKKAVFNSINKQTGFSTKMYDMIKRNSKILAKGYHFLASLNPLSNFKFVQRMRDVNQRLEGLQKYLEVNRGFTSLDKDIQNTIEAVERISKKINEGGLSKCAKHKEYKKMTKLLGSIEEQQKIEQAEIQAKQKTEAEEPKSRGPSPSNPHRAE